MNKGLILGIALSAFVAVTPSNAEVAKSTITNWQIDPAHSSASFGVKHMMVSTVRGNLGTVNGHGVYDGKHLANASVSATIDAAGINTQNAQRDEHLKSPDFLDTKNYPTITFTSTKFENTNSGVKVYGNLTIHGVTKPVILLSDAPTAIVKDPYGNNRFGVNAHTNINRKDYGVSFNKTLDNGGAMVSDDVAIQLDVEMTQAKE